MTPRTRHNIKNGFYLALFIGSVAGFTFWFMTLAAQAAGPTGEWHTWEVQGDYGPDWDQNYDEAFAQPQKHVGEGQLAPECGTWYQQDFYPYAAQKHGKTIAEVIEDGLLHDGEDHHLTGHKDGEWRFVYGGDCAPEPDPMPTPDPSPTVTPEPEPSVTPEPEPTPDPVPSVTPDPSPEPEPVEETRAHSGASSCVPGEEGLAVQSFTEDFYVDGVLVDSRSWTEHVADAGCTVPEPESTPDVPPAPTADGGGTTTPVLAATGAEIPPLTLAAALGLVGAGVAIVRKRWTA